MEEGSLVGAKGAGGAHPTEPSVTTAPPYPGVWKEGEFQGIRTGITTLADVQRRFGSAPFDAAVRADNSLLIDWYFYTFTEGPLAGHGAVEVFKSSGIVRRVILWGLDKKPTLRDLEGLFGKKYILARYSFDECLEDGDAAPVFEDAAGQLLRYEFRAQGIAVSVDEAGALGEVQFGALPVGPVTSQCPPMRDAGTD